VTAFPHTWPKHCQVSPSEWIFVAGGMQNSHEAVPFCYKLNTETKKIEKIADLPSLKLAHQVIYLPATPTAPQGSVYVFGGKPHRDMGYSLESCRFDLAT